MKYELLPETIARLERYAAEEMICMSWVTPALKAFEPSRLHTSRIGQGHPAERRQRGRQAKGNRGNAGALSFV